MIRNRIAQLAVALVAGLVMPTVAVAAVVAVPSGDGVSVVSVASVQDEPDPGATKPANCGTANTPPCEA